MFNLRPMFCASGQIGRAIPHCGVKPLSCKECFVFDLDQSDPLGGLRLQSIPKTLPGALKTTWCIAATDGRHPFLARAVIHCA